jgi:urease accessory protein
MGLEAFAEAGELKDAEDLDRVVKLYLSVLATSDCVALRAAHGEENLEMLFRVDRLLAATKLTRELRSASASTGKRFLISVVAMGVEDATLAAFTDSAQSGKTLGNMAVAYGAAAPVLGVGINETLHAYLYASIASLVAAGQKTIPLGGSVAQRVLFELHGEMEDAVMKSGEIGIEEMYAFAPEIDLCSMRHERQRTRLYIS